MKEFMKAKEHEQNELEKLYRETKSEEETEKNVPSASVAQALARYVLPVPGG